MLHQDPASTVPVTRAGGSECPRPAHGGKAGKVSVQPFPLLQGARMFRRQDASQQTDIHSRNTRALASHTGITKAGTRSKHLRTIDREPTLPLAIPSP